jgi:cell division protein FtsB
MPKVLEASSKNIDELRYEKEMLESQISKLKENIESQLLLARQEAALETKKVTESTEKLYKESDRLKADRSAFQAVLVSFKDEKDAFEKDRSLVLASKKSYDDMKMRLDACIEKMRRAMENL